MSRPDTPIKDRLRDPADEQALRRIWSGVAARSLSAKPRHRARPFVLLSAAGAMAGVAVLLVNLLNQSGREPGPLQLTGGGAIVSTVAPSSGATLSLSDGSRIELSAGTRLEPLESSSSVFLAVVAGGNATFDVRPGGPRRWQIECGLATVEVIGTRFSCERQSDRLRVAVQRGAVLVRGERIPDRVRRLAAGQSLEVTEAAPSAALPAPAAAATAAAVAPGLEPAAAPAPARAGAIAWRELARGGHHEQAFATLGSGGVRREMKRAGIADLFALADVARLSGHPAEAVAPLERIQTEFAADPQASLAAFALGRLELDTLGRPGHAAVALSRALQLHIPRSLREDVRARLVEAYARMGNDRAAAAAAQAYDREFPQGRFAERIKALTANR